MLLNGRVACGEGCQGCCQVEVCGVIPGPEVDCVTVRIVQLGRGNPGEASIYQVVVEEERLGTGVLHNDGVACAYADVAGVNSRGPERGVAGRVLWMTWEGRSSCLGWTKLGASEAGAFSSAVVMASGVAWLWRAPFVASANTEEGVCGL